MAGNERLIDRDPRDEEEPQAPEPFYKNATFVLVLKLSLSLGVISSLLTGLLITNARLSTVEAQLAQNAETMTQLLQEKQTLNQQVSELSSAYEVVNKRVGTLDLTAAKGELRQTVDILDKQSQNFDQQLAVTRNGMMSLSRMVKGTRVWQEDYRGQYEDLFEANRQLKQAIGLLKGENPDESAEQDPRYLEVDF